MVCVQTLLSLGLSYGGCLSMVHMTMRSVKPSCLNVSAHTRPAGPVETLDLNNTGTEIDPMQLHYYRLTGQQHRPEPMMRTWLNPVLELMTAEHRAIGFDLFCD